MTGKHSRRPKGRIGKWIAVLSVLLCVVAIGTVAVWTMVGVSQPGLAESEGLSETSSSAEETSSEAVSEEPSSQVSSEEVSSVASVVSEETISSEASSETSSEEPSSIVVVQPEELKVMLEAAGYTLEDIDDVGQLVLTASYGSSATVHYYEKDEYGQWSSVFEPSDGFVGINGVGDAHEGSLFTPYGLYTLDFAFGNAANPGTAMEYREVTESIYWVDDPDSRYYNQWVDAETAEVWDWDSAEHLSAVSVYDYAVVIGYNKDRIPGEGSAFFLHSSSGSPTAGCVSVPSAHMVEILRWLDPMQNPHIIMF